MFLNKTQQDYSVYLKEKYPSLFRASPPVEVDIPRGWHSIVDLLCYEIDNKKRWDGDTRKYFAKRKDSPFTIDDPERDTRIAAILERNHSLYFTIYESDSFMNGLIKMAERLAGRTCHVCGCPGDYQESIGVVCNEHM